MKMKEYLLNDFFDISTTKSVDKNKIKFKNNAPYDFIGRTSTDWGVQGTVEKLDFAPNPKDSFSLVQVGETVALWREKEWYASQNLFLLKPKVSKIKDTFLYFQAVINKEMSSYGNAYNSYPTMKSLSKTNILLPVTTRYIPDFESLEILAGGGTDMSSIDTSSWKEFLITDLFELCPTTTKLTKLDLCNTGVVPVYSSETSNNGINGYTDVTAQFIVDEKTPLYLVFGDHTRSMNIADESFCVMDNVKVLKPKYSVSVEVLLYISTVWKKAIPNLGYARHWSVAKDLSIKLPVKESEEINWEYMQERISELEQERISELEQYLIAAGLNDYELTDEDKEVLELFREVI